MDNKLDNFVTTFDAAAEGLSGESFGDVIDLGDDLEALEASGYVLNDSTTVDVHCHGH